MWWEGNGACKRKLSSGNLATSYYITRSLLYIQQAKENCNGRVFVQFIRMHTDSGNNLMEGAW